MRAPTTATFEVFAAGTHTNSQVPTREFTTTDIDAMVALRASIKLDTSQLLLHIGNLLLKVGGSLICARIHNEGGTIVPVKANLRFFIPGVGYRSAKKGQIPQRQFVGISGAAHASITRVLHDALNAAIGVGGNP